MQQALRGQQARGPPSRQRGAGNGVRAARPARLKAGPRARASAATEQAEEDAVAEQKRDIQQMLNRPYKYGFQTIIESETFPKGLDEDVVRAISAKKNEPEWMLDFRLRAFRKWLTMEEPRWSDNEHPAFDYQGIRRAALRGAGCARSLCVCSRRVWGGGGIRVQALRLVRRLHACRGERAAVPSSPPPHPNPHTPSRPLPLPAPRNSYYSQPKVKEKKASLDEVDPELLRTFDKVGPLLLGAAPPLPRTLALSLSFSLRSLSPPPTRNDAPPPQPPSSASR
jgi:hypothetical protein